jgi:hypothetical protein
MRLNLRASVLVLPVAALLAGCGGSSSMVPLLTAAGVPVVQPISPEVPLEVVTRSTGVRDPLPVEGSSVTFGDVETTLGHAVSSAAVPWAQAHRAQRPEGWQITVELTQAEASFRDGRLIIGLNARATLRTRYGRTFLAQSQASCRQGAVVAVEGGAPVVFTCMEHLSRDLAGWLGQVEP